MKNMPWKDTRRKAQQWSFTVPSFTKALLNHLSTVINNPKVIYITFAVCDDDTGNQFIKRTRVSELNRLIGPCFPKMCTRAKSIILEIQMAASFQEFGEDTSFLGWRQNISMVMSWTTVHPTYVMEWHQIKSSTREGMKSKGSNNPWRQGSPIQPCSVNCILMFGFLVKVSVSNTWRTSVQDGDAFLLPSPPFSIFKPSPFFFTPKPPN